MGYLLLFVGGALLGFALRPINTKRFWIGMAGLMLVIIGAAS